MVLFSGLICPVYPVSQLYLAAVGGTSRQHNTPARNTMPRVQKSFPRCFSAVFLAGGFCLRNKLSHEASERDNPKTSKIQGRLASPASQLMFPTSEQMQPALFSVSELPVLVTDIVLQGNK